MLDGCHTVCHFGTVPPTRTLELLDTIHGGQIIPALLRWQSEGLSLIARHDRLRDEFGVDVSTSTIRRWTAALPDPEPEAA